MKNQTNGIRCYLTERLKPTEQNRIHTPTRLPGDRRKAEKGGEAV